MHTLFVGPARCIIYTSDCPHLEVYPLYVRGRDGLVLLEEKGSFADIDDVKIVALRTFLGIRTSRQLPLTAGIKIAISKFLFHFHLKDAMSFDCYSFACLVNGVEDEGRVDAAEFRRKWRRVSKPWMYRPGDTVLLVNNDFGFKHAAVYAGHNLWLSVYGAGGELQISRLSDMKRDFDAPLVYSILPR